MEKREYNKEIILPGYNTNNYIKNRKNATKYDMDYANLIWSGCEEISRGK